MIGFFLDFGANDGVLGGFGVSIDGVLRLGIKLAFNKLDILEQAGEYSLIDNSKIITFYNDIKNFLSLLQYKTIDKIKIIPDF